MLGPLFIVLGAAALLGAIIAIWQSARRLLAPPPTLLEAALEGDDRATLLAHKTAVLMSLKDLELDRSIGKISEADYTTLEAQQRARAKDILRALQAETSPYASEAEKLVDGAIGSEPVERKREPEPEPAKVAEPEPPKAVEAAPEPEPAKAAEAPPECPKCKTVNDADATFCKKCATRLREEEAS